MGAGGVGGEGRGGHLGDGEGEESEEAGRRRVFVRSMVVGQGKGD